MVKTRFLFIMMIIYFPVFFLTAHFYGQDTNNGVGERGVFIGKKKKRGSKSRKKKDQVINKKKKFLTRINTHKDFQKVKKKNVYAFLIGNDKYEKESDFAPLKQCGNDVLLLKRILTHCVKADPIKIHANYDLTLDEFKARFAKFVQKVNKDKDAMVLITYSGHGNDDGSLVFVRGGMLKPIELKDLVNSFKNDTVVVLDACYSGNNEGPREAYKKGKKQDFKSNSLRVYASLAHLTAKEIKYSSQYFKEILPFYRDVLKIKEISGNGYFTAMIGLFFAEYRFKPDENISFKDLVNYVTNKGKQYVEFLALGKKSVREAGIRLNQQPKILPIKEKVDFQDVNHNFILTQKPIKPVGLEPAVTGGIFFPLMSDVWGQIDSPALSLNMAVNYEMDFLTEGLFAQLNMGFISLFVIPSPNRRDIDMSILIPSLGLKYRPFKFSFFSMTLGAQGGMAFSFLRVGSFGAIKEETNTFTNVVVGGDLSVNFEIFRDFNLIIPGKFLYIMYEEPMYGLSVEMGVQYYF